jgi:hypothetical protein
MFRLHDKTRRRVSLVAFFGLCVVPTLFVLVWGVARHLPGHARAEEKRLSWQLGQKVSLGKVRHLRPGLLRYEDLEVSDPETGRLILRCRALEVDWERSSDQSGRSRPSLVMTASEPELDAAALGQVWELIERVLAGRAGSSEVHVRLAADQLTLRSAESPQKLTEVQGRIETLPAKAQADFLFRLAELPTPEPVQIRIGRNRQTEPPTTGFGLYTGGGALPCSWLAPGLPEFEAFGPQSRFRGYFWASRTPEGWDGELTGQFSDVDLERLVADRFSHTLRGSGQLTIQTARFRQGRLDQAAGSLLAGPGVISRSLLSAAALHLDMIPGLAPNTPGALLAYEELALGFRIDPRGLQLRGGCAPSGSGVVLAGPYGPLLAEPVSQPLPVAALVQTLVPEGKAHAPATRQTGWLLGRLPVPDGLPTQAAEVSSSPTRIGRAASSVER